MDDDALEIDDRAALDAGRSWIRKRLSEKVIGRDT